MVSHLLSSLPPNEYTICRRSKRGRQLIKQWRARFPMCRQCTMIVGHRIYRNQLQASVELRVEHGLIVSGQHYNVHVVANSLHVGCQMMMDPKPRTLAFELVPIWEVLRTTSSGKHGNISKSHCRLFMLCATHHAINLINSEAP